MVTNKKLTRSIILLGMLNAWGSYANEATSASKSADTLEKTKSSVAVISSAEQLKQQDEENKSHRSQFRIPNNVDISLWADSTQAPNPAFFNFDSQGRLLITDIDRIQKGVIDMRKHIKMVVDDILSESNEDRLKMMQSHSDLLPMSFYSEHADSVRLLEDRDNDGRAETATAFVAKLNDPLDGLASDVIERDGKVYVANIPHLLVFEDTDGDGVADQRKSLQDGFGIRFGFIGHDMHGLMWGPDGKLYWSIGDRGYSFTNKEGKKIHGPNLGAIFRANSDGSNLEVFYTGLRNPQELAFDDYGNIFTADNDGDGGDLERIEYIVEGGDSGWHAGHQSIITYASRIKLRSQKYANDPRIPTPWLVEEMWKPRNDKQPAFMLPTVGQINGGPSGFLYNPSVSFGESWAKHFFVVHYKGSPQRSYISTFQVQDQGAGFETTDHEQFVRGLNVADIGFGPDGRLYMSEFNESGWQPNGTGSIYAVKYKGKVDEAFVQENNVLLTADYTQKSVKELSSLLARDHQGIRLKAQFELAKRGLSGVDVFAQLAVDTSAELIPRLHGIWGLGQIKTETSGDVSLLEPLKGLLGDANATVRTQAARVLGDHRIESAAELMRQALNDPNKRVAMYAGIAIGRMGYASAVPTVIDNVRKNDGKDLYWQHGLIMALAGIDKSLWLHHKDDPSTAVRMAVLLSLRKAKDADISLFLQDSNPRIADEAIIAINDLQIIDAREAGAQVLARYVRAKKSALPERAAERFMHHRLINLNYDLGDTQAAERILSYAANPHLHVRLASEALAAIEGWNDVHSIDTTTGLPSSAQRDRADIKGLITRYLPRILEAVKGQALVQAMRLADAVGYKIEAKVLLNAAKSMKNLTNIRVQAMDTLLASQHQGLRALANTLLSDDVASVRAKALEVVYQLDPKVGVQQAMVFAKSDDNENQQAGFALLASTKDDQSASLIAQYLQAVIDGSINKSIILEVVAAAKARGTEEKIAPVLKAYDNKMASADVMAQFTGALEGGNAERGKALFSSGTGECLRCHVVNRRGGKVGPDLSAIGKTADHYYLLQALVDPSATIAPGFGSISFKGPDGELISGTYMGETEKSIKVMLSKKVSKNFKKSEISNISNPISGMPPMNYLMKEYELRDMVAYLATLETRGRQPVTSH